MSMWEIEALMENTVRLIDKGEFKPNQKRNLIWNVYNLQNQFDCKFTHFRVMDILLKNNFVQPYEVNDFPMAKEYPSFFSELLNQDFKWINSNPNQEWSENNQAIAYWDKKGNKIYADFGTPYYTINPSEKVVVYEPLDLGLQIIEEANKQQDKSSIYNWTAFMVNYSMAWFPTTKTLEALKHDYFQKIKTSFQQFDYSNYDILHEGLSLSMDKNKEEWFTENQKELIKYLTK